MTTLVDPATLTVDDLVRMTRAAMKDKTYQDFPLGKEAAAYLRIKKKRLTATSYRDYEGCLDKFARYYPALDLRDFEPPRGTRRIEEFLDSLWGDSAPRTYNKNLSIVRDFFKHHLMRAGLQGDPTLAIERARARQVYRTTFSPDQRHAIIASQADLRDRICLRLLLDYGLRKGALQAVQFKHFDAHRGRLTIFTKGRKVREMPIPQPAFWNELLELTHQTDPPAQPNWFLLPRRSGNQHSRTLVHTLPNGIHGTHDWWYRCLENAGIVARGERSGERMHKARHSAGQRLLDDTKGNLKAVQKFLGHSTIQTTADIYTDWDDAQLEASLFSVFEGDEYF